MVILMEIVINNHKISLIIGNSFIKRLKGFMFKKNINCCLCFPKCNSIHTFFMFEAIDVIMTDKNNNVLYVFKNLKPWKMILPKPNVYYVYEFPHNFIGNEPVKLKIKNQ